MEKPTKIAKKSAREAGVRYVTKELRSEADFKMEKILSALADAASGQRKDLGEPLDGSSPKDFSRK